MLCGLLQILTNLFRVLDSGGALEAGASVDSPGIRGADRIGDIAAVQAAGDHNLSVARRRPRHGPGKRPTCAAPRVLRRRVQKKGLARVVGENVRLEGLADLECLPDPDRLQDFAVMGRLAAMK